jgi:Tol biopolymer transport system component
MLCLLGLAGAAVADTLPEPQIFAPGEISASPSEDCFSMTPDGDTAVFDISNGSSSAIVISHKSKGHWSKPEIAPFSGQWYDHDPAVSPDGKFIVFPSSRPPKAGDKPVGGLWRVDRKGKGWGEPVRLPDSVNVSPRIYAPTITADGSIYFIRPDDDGILHIFRSQYKDGTYQPAVRQMLGDASTHQKDPAIAPDESFVVFDTDAGSTKDVDRLVIAFREGDHWGVPMDLGDVMNANNNPWGAHVSADGKTLYFNSDRAIKVVYPRSHEQAAKDFERLMSWDDGESNIWSVPLAPYIAAHAATKG